MIKPDKNIPKLPNRDFTSENAVANNGVFLLKGYEKPPFSWPVNGWKFVGYGKAAWSKGGEDFAIMLEKISLEESTFDCRGADFPEGTRLWHHYDKDHWDYYVKGLYD